MIRLTGRGSPAEDTKLAALPGRLSSGVVAEQATHTARGTPGNRSNSRLYRDFGKPRCREAPGSTGPSGPGVPRALELFGAHLD